MVGAALDTLIGAEPIDDVMGAALATIPPAELPDALGALVRVYGLAVLPLLRYCLTGRPDWASAAAPALATLAVPEAAEALAQAEGTTRDKPARTAIRRALYRLRQAGIAPPAPARRPRAVPLPTPSAAWVSLVDGTGSRGVWLVVDGPSGQRTLLSAVLNDEVGILDLAGGAITRRELGERLSALRAESPLPWVAAPPAWVAGLFIEARERQAASGRPVPVAFDRWLRLVPAGAVPETPPVYERIPPTVLAEDPTLLDHSADVLALPELSGWFLDPASVQAEALELLAARESRLVLSEPLRAERVTMVVDRAIEAHFAPEARVRWQRRLEETAFVLLETARPLPARRALAAARALADPARSARHVPFIRALVEKSLEVAGEVALGRRPAAEVSRRPRGPETSARQPR